MKNSRYRLSSSAFERKEELNQIEWKKVIFLSVEGDETERNYFEHLGTYLEESVIHVEVLRRRRGAGYSSPEQVIELLEEYVELRDDGAVPQILPATFMKMYSKEDIQKYIDTPEIFTKAERSKFNEELLKLGIDLKYRRYLSDFEKGNDFFGVVLDRDADSHSRELMIECIDKCNDEGYGCYITNPCFEFWLLLHLCDVKKEYSEEELKKMLKNPKITNKHTFVSNEVTKRAHHGKHISNEIFSKLYYPNIEKALSLSKDFDVENEKILDNLGSSLPQLFTELGYHRSEQR